MQDDRKEFLADVLTTAVEGGINYWAMVSNYNYDTPAETRVTVHELDDDGNPSGYVDITITEIARAIQSVLITDTSLPSHVRSTIRETNAENDAGDIDAELADVIMQFAVLGRITYG